MELVSNICVLIFFLYCFYSGVTSLLEKIRHFIQYRGVKHVDKTNNKRMGDSDSSNEIE